VRQTALVDRVDTLHKLRCTVLPCTLHKIRVSRHKIRFATKRLKFPSTAFILLPALDSCSEFDTPNYTLDTLQLPNSLLSKPCLPPISQTCRGTPFPPKTWSVIITTNIWCKDSLLSLFYILNYRSFSSYHLHL
jgi:hypothetical protein